MRIVRRALRLATVVILSLVSLVVATAVALLLFARTTTGERKLLAIALSQAKEHLNGELRIGRVAGDLTRGLEIYDVELYDAEGVLAVRAGRVALRYDLMGLLENELRLEDATIEGGWVRARVMRDGKLNLAEIVKPSKSSSQPFNLIARHLGADVELRYEPAPKRDPGPLDGPFQAHLLLDGKIKKLGVVADVALARLAIATSLPARATIEVKGGVHAEGNLPELKDLSVVVKTEGAEVRRVLPKVLVRGSWEADLHADGKLGGLAVQLKVKPPRGELTADAALAIHPRGEVTWRGTVNARDLDPGAAWLGVPHGRVALDASGEGQGARGSVDLVRLTADAVGTHAAAHGHFVLGAGISAEAFVDVSARDLSRLAAVGAPALAGQLELHAHVEHSPEHNHLDADLHGAGLGVAAARVAKIDARIHFKDLAGSAMVAARGVTAAELRIDHLEVAASGDPKMLALDVEARGAHGNELVLRAHGRPLNGADQLDAELSVDRLLVALHGQKWEATKAGKVVIDERLASAELELASGDQRLAVDGKFRRDTGAIELRIGGQKLDAERLALLAPKPRRMPKTNLAVSAHVTGTKDAPVVEVSLAGSSARNDRLGLDQIDLDVRGRYAGERVQGELAITSAGQKLHARVDAPIDFDQKEKISADIDAENVVLEKLKRYLPERLQSLRGRATLKARVWGTTRKPELDGTLSLPSWELASLKKNSTSLRVRYAGKALTAELKSSFATAKDPLGTVEARVSAPIDLQRTESQKKLFERLEHQTPIDAQVKLAGIDLGKLPLGQLGLHSPLSSGMLDGEVKLTGTLHDPDLHGKLSLQKVTTGGVDGLAVASTLDYENPRARVDVEATLRGAPIVKAHGETDVDFRKVVDHLAWKDAPLRVDVTIPSYDLAHFKQLQGTLAGKLEARGTIAHPTAKGGVHVDGLRVAAMRFSRVSADGSFDGARAIAKVRADEQPGGTLRLDANLPLAADQPIKVVFAAKQLAFDLDHLGSLRTLKTKLDAELAVSGTRAQPRLDGYARIDDGQVGVVSQARIYQRLQLDVALSNGAVELKKFAVAVGTGWLHASGTAALDGFKPTRVDLNAEANRFPIANGSVGAWLDANVEVHGQRKDGALVGQLTVKTATAHLPRLATGKKLQSTAPLADVVYVDEQAQRERVAKERAEHEGAQLELKAHIPGPFKVRSPEMMTDLKGELDVEVVGSVAKVSGNLETTWGWLELLGRRYDLEHARLGFDGEAVPNPELDLRVTREVTDALIVIEVHGTARRPQLTLTSEPPIYDQSQIIGIIISGDPAASRISDKSSDAKVVGALSGLLVNKIKDQIAPGLPIDVIKVDTSGDDSAGIGQTRLEVGKYLTDSLYVSYVHQFGSPQGTRRTNSNQAQLEYRFKKRYALDTLFGDAGQGAVDLFWTLRY